MNSEILNLILNPSYYHKKISDNKQFINIIIFESNLIYEQLFEDTQARVDEIFGFINYEDRVSLFNMLNQIVSRIIS